MKKEYEAMMLHRGFDTKGFKSLDDMTYPEKQATAMVLVPELSMKIDAHQNPNAVDNTGQLRGELVLNIIEPLSKERLWIKRLPLEGEIFNFKEGVLAKQIRNQQGKVIGMEVFHVGSADNRPQRVAKALEKFFQDSMSTSWKFFSPQELMVLKQHSDEIRKMKRF
jgi:hypothetical protein